MFQFHIGRLRATGAWRVWWKAWRWLFCQSVPPFSSRRNAARECPRTSLAKETWFVVETKFILKHVFNYYVRSFDGMNSSWFRFVEVDSSHSLNDYSYWWQPFTFFCYSLFSKFRPNTSLEINHQNIIYSWIRLWIFLEKYIFLYLSWNITFFT